jgi:hypothetical protein
MRNKPFRAPPGALRRALPAGLLLLSLLLGAPRLLAEAAGPDILAKVDAFRSFGGSGYSYDFATVEDGGEASLMRVAVRLGSPGTKGVEAALVKYLEPVKSRGRAVLVRGNAFWLYEPGMKTAIRISPRQLLFGQASAGDVSRISFSSMYALKSSEAIDGGYRLRLEARPGSGATYELVELRTAADFRPASAACMGANGLLMKTILYEGYEEIRGRQLLTAFTIRNEIDGKTTKVSLGKFDASIPAESSFAVQALKYLR